MAKIQFKGVDEYIARLKRLGDNTEKTIGETIYVGADIVADRVRSEISGLPVGNSFARNGERISAVTAAQKQGLLDGFGIASMRLDGTAYNVKLGFDGYNSQTTPNFPSGQPNSMIARSVCAGTSFRAPNNFMQRAVSGSKAAAEAAMEKKLDEVIKKLMG